MQLTTKWCRHNYYNNCLYYSALQKSKSAKSYSDINLFGLRTIYIVIFLCCSVLSLFSYGLLYSVCLLYIVVNNDILQRALQSVTKNGTTVFINTSCWPGFFLETFQSGGRSIKRHVHKYQHGITLENHGCWRLDMYIQHTNFKRGQDSHEEGGGRF